VSKPKRPAPPPSPANVHRLGSPPALAAASLRLAGPPVPQYRAVLHDTGACMLAEHPAGAAAVRRVFQAHGVFALCQTMERAGLPDAPMQVVWSDDSAAMWMPSVHKAVALSQAKP